MAAICIQNGVPRIDPLKAATFRGWGRGGAPYGRILVRAAVGARRGDLPAWDRGKADMALRRAWDALFFAGPIAEHALSRSVTARTGFCARLALRKERSETHDASTFALAAKFCPLASHANAFARFGVVHLEHPEGSLAYRKSTGEEPFTASAL